MVRHQADGWGFRSWKSYDSCWAVTVYYGLSFRQTQSDQYAQGTYEAAQIEVALEQPRLCWSVWQATAADN